MAVAVPQPGPQLVLPGLEEVHSHSVGPITVVKDTRRNPGGSGGVIIVRHSEVEGVQGRIAGEPQGR